MSTSEKWSEFLAEELNVSSKSARGPIIKLLAPIMSHFGSNADEIIRGICVQVHRNKTATITIEYDPVAYTDMDEMLVVDTGWFPVDHMRLFTGREGDEIIGYIEFDVGY